jgi:hypothetical protein
VFDGSQEIVVHFGRAALRFVGFGVFIERALQDGFFGKYGGDPVPLFREVPESANKDAGR